MTPKTRMPRRYYDVLCEMIKDGVYPNNMVTITLTGKPYCYPQGNYCITVDFNFVHPTLVKRISNRIDALMSQLDDTCPNIFRLTALESMYFMDANL